LERGAITAVTGVFDAQFVIDQAKNGLESASHERLKQAKACRCRCGYIQPCLNAWTNGVPAKMASSLVRKCCGGWQRSAWTSRRSASVDALLMRRLTGFDVECLSALYIDKPMKAETQGMSGGTRPVPGKGAEG